MNLAFHMTAAKLHRAENEDAKEARDWLFRDSPIDWIREAINPKTEMTAERRAEADAVLTLSREAGVLLPHPDTIEFEHQLTQECFCVLYCISTGVTEKLLAAQIAAREHWGADWLPGDLPHYPVAFGLWKGDLTLKRAIAGALDRLTRDGTVAAVLARYLGKGAGV